MTKSLKMRKQELVRDAIYDAAMDLFGRKGFNETTVDDTLNDYPDVKVDASHAYYDGPPDDEDWVDFDTPKNPYGIFMDSYYESMFLLGEHGGDGTSLVNRMVFGQQLSALEAYLSDTLINGVMEDPASLTAMLEKDKDLEKRRSHAGPSRSRPDAGRETVTSHLRGVLYHNLPKVDALYSIAFDIQIFDLLGEDKKTKLLQAVTYRHDCVHRNGHDAEGNRLDVFTKEYVGDLAI